MEAEPETKVVGHESKAPRREAPGVGFDTFDSRADRVVGRYELIHRLGHGGMATVFLARATGRAGFEKLVAVKVIHPHLGREPEFVDMFLDEARIAARLQHPHVVQILDVGEDRGVYFMVMEYIEGETLSSLIRQLRKHEQRLTLSAILQIAADTVEGLAAAHELSDRDGQPYQLVHRDVSPHNLLLGMDGNVKVVDFGIMKAAGKRSNTLTGQLRGKLSYMSPEQARGKAIDHRTDLFALGAVLWELCTNKRLFQGETESETLELVTRCEVPDLLRVRPDLPAGLGAVICKVLSRDACDRYESAQQMLRDIRELRRELSADVDPRAELAEVMSEHFGARINYVRAAVRARDGSGVRPASSGSASLAAEVAANGDATEIVDAQRGDSSYPRQSLGVPQLQTGVATLTSTLATAPARQWTLWLLLPLVGAGLGTAAVGLRQPDRAPQAPIDDAALATPPVRSAEEMPMTAQPPEVQASVPQVKWYVNTRPQGALVTIEGLQQEGRTPLTVVLPQSGDSVVIALQKDGYRPLEVKLAPLATANLDYALVEITTAPTVQSKQIKQIKPRYRSGKKKTQPVPASRPSAEPVPNKGDPDPDPDPDIYEDPDFDRLLGKRRKPG